MKTLEFKLYFFEPLRTMEKRATIRKSDKGLKKGDIVECTVKGSLFCLHRIVRRVEEVRFKDLNGMHAWFEGYKHVALLKHELKIIYPDICDDTVLFQILFGLPTRGVNDLRLRRRSIKMNKEEINKLTQKIESCWDENNPGDVRSFDERLKQKLTPEEYELITSWR